MINDKSNAYLTTSYGKRLTQKYTLDEVGVWQVRGEDGDSSIGPVLGVFEGELGDVINYAVELDRFFTYGYGGEITEIKVKKITADSNRVRKELAERIANLKSETIRLENLHDNS